MGVTVPKNVWPCPFTAFLTTLNNGPPFRHRSEITQDRTAFEAPWITVNSFGQIKQPGLQRTDEVQLNKLAKGIPQRQGLNPTLFRRGGTADLFVLAPHAQGSIGASLGDKVLEFNRAQAIKGHQPDDIGPLLIALLQAFDQRQDFNVAENRLSPLGGALPSQFLDVGQGDRPRLSNAMAGDALVNELAQVVAQDVAGLGLALPPLQRFPQQ